MQNTPGLPAVPPCVALLAGVLAAPAVHVTPGPALAAALVAALAHAASRPRLALLAGCLALFSCGIALELADRERARSRVAGCFTDGAALETEIVGTVRGTSETDAEGQRWFEVRTDGFACGDGRGDLTLAVRVAPAPSGTADDVDALGAGDRVRLWCRLKRPQGFLNPGSPDPATRLRIAGVDAHAAVKSPRLVELLVRGPRGAGRVADALKRHARVRLDQALGPAGDPRALAGAMLLGDRRLLDDATRRGLRDSGLAHLVAISGLHVGWVTLVVVGGLRRGRLNLLCILLLCTLSLSVFVQLVGSRPSVMRAAVAAGAVLFARAIGRDGAPLNTLALIAAALVLVEPASLRDPGFQLSFVATAGLLRGAERRSNPVVAAAHLSLVAYVATSPLVALHLGRQTPAGLAANLAGIPLAGLMLLAGYAWIGLGWVPLLGAVSAGATRLSAGGLLWTADLAASLPGGSFAVAPPARLTLLAYYALLALPPQLAVALPANAAAVLVRARLAALALVSLLVHAGQPPTTPGTAEVSVIDVGQGQAVTVRGPGGGAVLIDAGGSYGGAPDPGERVVIPYLLRSGVRRLDVLIVSHEHLDHIGGAAAVIRDLEVGQLWIGPHALRHAAMSELAAAARRTGCAIVLAERGLRRAPGGVPVEILSPIRREVPRNPNDDSVAVRLGHAPARLLIPGDLEASGEAALVASGLDLSAEALVLSHHGSRSGTSAAFLGRVAPRVTVVSAGRGNRFGHPHAEVLRRLDDQGVPLWRTDLHGRVRLVAGERGFAVDTCRPPSTLSPR